MDPSNDVTEFLSSRRARITPEQAGLPSYGTRRVPGLRREEVASLAGVSVEYYKRLERGNLNGVSELVLEGLANALALDDAEREHLFDLARAAGPVAPRRPRASHRGVRPNVQRILDALDTPAVARAAYGNYVAANALGRALYAPLFDSGEQPANSARFTFLDPAATEFYLDWDRVASDLVAHLRSEAGGKSHDRALTDLVGELSTRSEVFASSEPRTMCAFIAPAPNESITRSSESWSSASRRWRSSPTKGWRSTFTPPNRAAALKTRCTCLPAGRPRPLAPVLPPASSG
ncbi:MAG TPA: helix-turn-helix transcriptional regulator [Solirubrobacteraceae bacterium]